MLEKKKREITQCGICHFSLFHLNFKTSLYFKSSTVLFLKLLIMLWIKISGMYYSMKHKRKEMFLSLSLSGHWQVVFGGTGRRDSNESMKAVFGLAKQMPAFVCCKSLTFQTDSTNNSQLTTMKFFIKPLLTRPLHSKPVSINLSRQRVSRDVLYGVYIILNRSINASRTHLMNLDETRVGCYKELNSGQVR